MLELKDSETTVEGELTNDGRIIMENEGDYRLVKVRYMHSDIDTMERIEIVSALRNGEFDVLCGINLLREGLDLPEVKLLAILEKSGILE